MWRRGALGLGGVGVVGLGWYYASSRSVISTRSDFQIATPEVMAQKDLLIPQREEHLADLKSGKEYDLLVIGGGATGLGVALDAACRGLDIALVEKDDFCSGTSSRSTKLIHGGVRYLEKAFWNLDKAQFDLVVEALHERAHLLKISPHLSHEIPIMLPIYSWFNIPYYWAGSKAYDFLAGKEGLQRSYFLSRSMALEQFPMLRKDDLKGAMVYYDGMHNDARMGVSIALTAAAQGARLCNHVEVVSLLKEGAGEQGSPLRVCGAVVRDTLTGEQWDVRARGVINATGPFTDSIRRLDDPSAPPIVSPSSGVHVVLPDYYSPRGMGLLDPATSDGRLLFFLPWQGRTIAGTTDVPCGVSDRPAPTEAEVRFILHEIKRYLSPALKVRRGDVTAAWAGIRPLVRDPTKASAGTQGLARTHVVFESEGQLLNIAGGKWTTYRRMAEDVVDRAVALFGLAPSQPCNTEKVMLVGGHAFTPTLFIGLIQQHGLDRDVSQYLCENYGDRAKEVARLALPTGKRWPATGRRLLEGHPHIEAEVRYAVRHEYARTAEDVLARRTRLAFLDAFGAMEAAPRVVDILGEELGWSEQRRLAELESTKQFLLHMGLLPGGTESKFNKMDVIRFRDAFDDMAEGREYLTIDQIQALVSRFNGEHVPLEQVAALVDLVDSNSNGKVEFNEFLEIIALGNQGDGKHFLTASKIRSSIVAALEAGVTAEGSGGGL